MVPLEELSKGAKKVSVNLLIKISNDIFSVRILITWLNKNITKEIKAKLKMLGLKKFLIFFIGIVVRFISLINIGINKLKKDNIATYCRALLPDKKTIIKPVKIFALSRFRNFIDKFWDDLNKR